MSAIDNQPTNTNFLSPLGFKFVIKKLPNVNYFSQAVQIPSINMNAIDTPTPLAIIPRPGDRLVYDQLSLRFRVDEKLANYLEIHNWLTGLGHPKSLTQTRDLSRASDIPKIREGSALSMVSDGTLIVLSSHKNPNVNVFFRDMFPTSLTELLFDSTSADVEYLEATATFRYLRYDVEVLA